MKSEPTALPAFSDGTATLEPQRDRRQSDVARSPGYDSRSRRRDQRIDIRFDKLFPVTVSSEIFGDAAGIARNVSAGGALVEMGDLLPLGSVVVLRFRAPGTPGELALRAEVKHHYCLNYETPGANTEPRCIRAVGLRFVEMTDDDVQIMHGALPVPEFLH